MVSLDFPSGPDDRTDSGSAAPFDVEFKLYTFFNSSSSRPTHYYPRVMAGETDTPVEKLSCV